MTPAIDVRELSRAFGATRALDRVSLSVAPGELFGLIGPDGAGKSTLFRILTTLILPDSGGATVLGLDVARDLWAIRARVGYMPGTFSLYPDLTVRENLAFFASVFGTSVEKGYELIAPVYSQLAPFENRRAEALSGGMKQKLALSCALVHRPQLLLLDEPTTGVDAVSRREFWGQLAALRSGGLTVLVSTPYMDEALRCDRVALIQAGRILGIDTPAAIGASYPLPLLAVRVSRRRAALRDLRAHPHARSTYPFGETLHHTDARADADAAGIAGEIADYLRARGHADAVVEPAAPGIEDTFMFRMQAGAA